MGLSTSLLWLCPFSYPEGITVHCLKILTVPSKRPFPVCLAVVPFAPATPSLSRQFGPILLPLVQEMDVPKMPSVIGCVGASQDKITVRMVCAAASFLQSLLRSALNLCNNTDGNEFRPSRLEPTGNDRKGSAAA